MLRRTFLLFWPLVEWIIGPEHNLPRACSHGSGGHLPMVKKILVFTCNPREAGWGAFRFNVAVAGETLVWFCWLARLSDSTLKLPPALSILSLLWRFWRWNRWNNLPSLSDLITLVRQVTPLHGFLKEKTHPTKAGYPDGLNPPWWGTPLNMWMWSIKEERLYGQIGYSPGQGTSPAWGPLLPCVQALRPIKYHMH